MSSSPPRPTPEQLARYADGFNQSLALKAWGLTVSFPPEGDRVVAEVKVGPEHRGGMGTDAVNGGVLAAVFDLVIGCTPALFDPTRRTATVQLSMSFMKAVRGNAFRAEGRLGRAGGATLFSTARILDEQGQECASCQGVIKMSREKWSNPGTPAVKEPVTNG